MEIIKSAEFRYIYLYQVSNRITDTGCEWLTKKIWPSLMTLALCIKCAI